jgi:hypothetical protein
MFLLFTAELLNDIVFYARDAFGKSGDLGTAIVVTGSVSKIVLTDLSV